MTPIRLLASDTPALAVISVVLLTAVRAAVAAPLLTELPADQVVPEFPLPADSRYFDVHLAAMRDHLSAAPMESFDSPTPGLALALPLPDHRSEEFRVWETPVMHPDLARRYPEIKTYAGRGIDNRYATVRITVTPKGFHGMILSEGGTVFIDPVARDDNRTHASHYQSTAERIKAAHAPFRCDFRTDPVVETEIADLVRRRSSGLTSTSTGQDLRTYRACVAATGEYTNYHGGTVAAGLAAIVVSVNRVTGIFEQEVSVRLQLIANNDLVVYTDGATDPYTNSSGSTMLGENQSNLNAVIGLSNYDIGHVFGTGGGGIAGLGVVCASFNKAYGVTGHSNPIGDPFDVDYVSHEMGHQFGATHTFNGDAGSCGGNRTSATAYETGSGVTIMSYSGVCGSQNIATYSVPLFHGASFDQITAYTQSGLGSVCPTMTATGNLPPVATAGNAGLTLPISTPFEVSGAMTEPDGDPVTFNWEQFDLGPAGDPSSPSGNAPIFRNWQSFANRDWRMFPRRSDVRNNTSTYGELLPTYSRSITLRLTIRDGLGGVAFDTTTLAVDGGSGPFLVTSIDAVPWYSGEMKTITWNVANTDVAPVSAPFVNIELSTDDGRNFTEMLATGTPNDGSEAIVVPGVATTQARVRVIPTGNVFFDMNDSTFVIAAPTDAPGVPSEAPKGLQVRPNPFSGRTAVSFVVRRRGRVAVSVYDAGGRRIATLSDGVREAGPHAVAWNGRDASGAPVFAGVYFVRMECEDGVETARVVQLR